MRLPGCDNTQAGACFVAVVAQDRAGLFGEMLDGGMRLNGWGKIVQPAWYDQPRHYPHVALDAFVIMLMT